MIRKSIQYIWISLVLITSVVSFQHAVVAQNSNSPLKIGYVNANEVVSNAPQAKIALEELNQKYSPREAELLDMQAELRKIEEQLTNPEGNDLTEAEISQLRSEARALDRELERASADLNEDYNFDRNRRLEELQALISEVILTMAKEEKFDLIVQSPVVWASPRIDVTGDILERLEELSQQ